MGFPSGLVVKHLLANAGDAGSIFGLGRSPGERNGNPFQYSCLGNRGPWWPTLHGVTKSQIQRNNRTTTTSLCLTILHNHRDDADHIHRFHLQSMMLELIQG